MGGRGSGGSLPRKPSHLRALEGVRESRLNRDELLPAEGMIVPAVVLPADAQAVWNRLAPDLIAKRVLTKWDVDAFAAYCRAVAMFYRYAAELDVEGASVQRKYTGSTVSPALRALVAAEKMMASLGSRFGMTPADRAALKVDHSGGSKSGAESYVI